MSEGTLVVLARVPELGRVKTRLERRFSSEVALELYREMLAATLALARSVGPPLAERAVHWATRAGGRLPAGLLAALSDFRHERQSGKDLGARMAGAIRAELDRGARFVVLIGCDSPHLPREYVTRAAGVLGSADVVLGPSEDGGYYLVGANRPVPAIFERIEWGGSAVLAATLERARRAGLRVELLPEWYDLDRPEDLDRAFREGHLSELGQIAGAVKPRRPPRARRSSRGSPARPPGRS